MKNITYYMQYDKEKYTGSFELDKIRTERGAKKAAKNIAIQEGIKNYYIVCSHKDGKSGIVVQRGKK